MSKIIAPFTSDQVRALNHFQEHINFHPFTCGGGNGDCRELEQNNEGKLFATAEGWLCPCGTYKQDWAHDFMAQPANDVL